MSPTSNSPARVILAIDHPGWAYHRIASQIVARLTDERMIFRIALSSELRNEDCDLLVSFAWRESGQLSINNRPRKRLLCVYDHVSWTQSETDRYMMEIAIQECDAIAVANQEIGESLRLRRLATKPVFIVEDGVDTGVFVRSEFPPTFTVGWAGNSQAAHGSIKGLPLIEEACKIARAELRIADLASNRPITTDAMPAWYAGISTYVCASTAEGTPNPVLEAAACGRPIISTRCGIVGRVITDGIGGYLVERSPEDIAAAIEKVRSGDMGRMGAAAQRAAAAHDWALKIEHWRACLYGVLGL